jgi:hypothetical protein
MQQGPTLPLKASLESASLIGGLTKPKTIRQQAVAFIRWRKARGYEVTPFKREFWGRKAWRVARNRQFTDSGGES